MPTPSGDYQGRIAGEDAYWGITMASDMPEWVRTALEGARKAERGQAVRDAAWLLMTLATSPLALIMGVDREV